MAWMSNWPSEVVRAKGIVWVATRSQMAQSFSQAGPSIQFGPAGYWVAALPDAERDAILRDEPKVAEHWHPLYGDRINKLVFIGIEMNRGQLTAYPAVVTITPNAGVGWEFNEAIDKTWPAGNWYAESGSFAVSIIKNTTNAGNIANAIAQYNQSYDTKNVTSLGLSLSATGGGFSIGWTNTTKVNTIPAYTDFTY